MRPESRFAPVVLILVLALTSATAIEARVRATYTRIGPSDLWCPLSTTRSDQGTGVDSSPTALNLGRYETSFRAPADGEVLVVLQTPEDDVAEGLRIDNIFAVERARLFDDLESFWSDGSSNCYEGSVEDNPQARVPFFDPPDGFDFDYVQLFEASQGTLEGEGWFFRHACVEASVSAVEVIPDEANPDDATDEECTGTSSTYCTGLSGSLLLEGKGASDPAVVSFPMGGLVPGTVYTLVMWWYFAPSFELSVDVLDEEIPLQGMGNSVTTCEGTLTDDGGFVGDYGNDKYFQTTIYPSGGSGKVVLDFTDFETASAEDLVGIHDGPDDSATDLGNFSGTNSPGVVTSTHSTGSLTIEFMSDGSGVAPGFAADITCILFADGFESGNTSAWSSQSP
jgi:hypothetical protein